MSSLVIFFFILTTVSVLVSSTLFIKKSENGSALNNFGKGLLSGGIAFAIWTIVLILRPVDLNLWVFIGVLVVFVGSLFFILSGSAHWQNRNLAKTFLWLVIIFDIVLFITRFFNPSQPSISDQGLFFFNPNPYVGFMDIIFLSVAIIPASLAAAKEIMAKHSVAAIFLESSMIVVLIGVIFLLTNYNFVILNLTGWAMGISFLAILYSAFSLKSLKN